MPPQESRDWPYNILVSPGILFLVEMRAARQLYSYNSPVRVMKPNERTRVAATAGIYRTTMRFRRVTLEPCPVIVTNFSRDSIYTHTRKCNLYIHNERDRRRIFPRQSFSYTRANNLAFTCTSHWLIRAIRRVCEAVFFLFLGERNFFFVHADMYYCTDFPMRGESVFWFIFISM